MSQNIRWAADRNNALGNPTTPARYGYRKEREGGKHIWVINEPEARRVRYAFDKAAQGLKYYKIRKGLDAIEAAEGTGVKWTQSRLYGMLRSENYIGDILTGKRFKPDYLQKRSLPNKGQHPQYYIEGHHEAIIEKEQFRRVAERIENERREKNEQNTNG